MASQIRFDGRNGEVWKRVAIHGWTQERVAEHFGMTQQRVSEIVAAVRAEIGPVITAELAQESMDTIKHIKAESLAIAEEARRGAPIFVGKDGNVAYEPRTQEEIDAGVPAVPVRDYSGYLRALETAARMDEMMAKRFGVNAPEKKEVDLKGSVRYEVAGIDPSDLT